MQIDPSLPRRLVAAQFPQWAGLPVVPVARGGWDNRSFHLGEAMLLRLPSAAAYAPQVEKEQRWLPVLAPKLPLPVPVPLAMGRPGLGYPWPWSVYRWIEGEPASAASTADGTGLAIGLAQFLRGLQAVATAGGPPPGAHNFHRGGPLAVYDGETREAIARLGDSIDGAAATTAWEAALQAVWPGPPVWLHGDVSPGNLLLRDGRLAAVIDWGMLAIGDPACDLAIAWSFFGGEAQAAFRAALAPDAESWARGRGWALWKALIVLAGLAGTDATQRAASRAVLDAVLEDASR